MVEGCRLVPLCERAVCDCCFDTILDSMAAYVVCSPEGVGAGKKVAWT